MNGALVAKLLPPPRPPHSPPSQVVIVHEGGDHPLLAYPSPDAIIRVTRIPLEGRAPGSPGPQLDFAQSFNRCVQAWHAWMRTAVRFRTVRREVCPYARLVTQVAVSVACG